MDMPVFSLNFFLFGCLGGLLPDILRLINSKYDPTTPQYLKTAKFWIILLLQVALGGLTAWLLGAATVRDALIFGFTAPEVITRLVGDPEPGGRIADRGMSARAWLGR